MKARLVLKTALLLVFLNISCNRTSYRENENLENASLQLKEALTNPDVFPSTIIPDSETAIFIAENILFKIYGKSNIQKQKPYKVDKIENYWIVNGSSPKNTVGGNFLIILDANDGKVIKIEHGK